MDELIEIIMRRIATSEGLFFSNDRQFSEKLTSTHIQEICRAETKKICRSDLLRIISSEESKNYADIFVSENISLSSLGCRSHISKRSRYKRGSSRRRMKSFEEECLTKMVFSIFKNTEESICDPKKRAIIASAIIIEVSAVSESYVEFSKFFVVDSSRPINLISGRPRSKDIDLVMPLIKREEVVDTISRIVSDEETRSSFLRSRYFHHIIAFSPETIVKVLDQYRKEDEESNREFFLARGAIIEKNIYDKRYSFEEFKLYMSDVIREKDVLDSSDISDILSPMMISALSADQSLEIINEIENFSSGNSEYFHSHLIGELATNLSKNQQVFIAPILLKYNLEDILYGI